MSLRGVSLALITIASLAGCEDDAKIVQQVVELTRQACHFQPDAKPIEQLIPTFGGVAATIADSICSSVNNTPRAAAVPGAAMAVTVRNVVVTGTVVR